MLLDTYVWVEIIKDSPEGRKAAEMFHEERLSTSMVSIVELSSWARRAGLNAKEIIGKVRSASAILDLTEEIAELAGEIHWSVRKDTPNWGMVDSIIYATAIEHGMSVATGDAHFRGKPNVVMI